MESASIPSVNHSNTIANFIKGYYVKQDYENQQVHIVTRLDRDTSGLMLFAKHGYAHARLDKQLQKKSIEKRYFALVKGDGYLEPEGEIIAPIARDEDSIITRRVAKGGKYAHTSYKMSLPMEIFTWSTFDCILVEPTKSESIFLILVFLCWEMTCMVVVWTMAFNVRPYIAITYPFIIHF